MSHSFHTPPPPPPPPLPQRGRGPGGPSRRAIWMVVLAGLATMLIIGGGLVGVAFFAVREAFQGGGALDRSATITSEPAATERSAQSAAAFNDYDAANATAADSAEDGPGKSATADDARVRQGIERLLSSLEACAQNSDNQRKFDACFDIDRHLARIAATGLYRMSFAEKFALRKTLRQDPDENWARLRLIKIVTPADDPQSRIVYAFGWFEDERDENEFRLWVARDGEAWRIYDWERLDLGMPESRRIAVCYKYGDSRLLRGYERWSDHIEAYGDAVVDDSEEGQVRARSALQRAEGETVPPELRDYIYLLTAYHWQDLGDHKEALRCYDRIADPAAAPGAWYGRMSCLEYTDPARAAEYGRTYQDRAASSPSLCRTLAQLYDRLDRPDDALAQWRKLLRFEPSDAWAWAAVIRGTPADQRPALLADLDKLPSPVLTAVQIGQQTGVGRPEVLALLLDYLRGKQPDAPATRRLHAMQLESQGEAEQAYEVYRGILSGPSDVETRDACFEALVNTSFELGQEVEAYQAAPDPAVAFEHFQYLYDEGEIEEAVMRRVVELHRERLPQDPQVVLRTIAFAIDDQKFAEAERDARALLAAEPEEEVRDQAFDNLAACLFHTGRWSEAYESLPPDSDALQRLAWLAEEAEQWDTLQALVDRRRVAAPDDPELAGMEGAIAAHFGRWPDAVRHYRRADELERDSEDSGESSSYSRYEFQYRFAAVRAGEYLAYYRQSKNQPQAFDLLAGDLLDLAEWDAFARLVAEHRQEHPDDQRIIIREAEAAWQRGDYATCVEKTSRLIDDPPDEEVLDPWRWQGVQDQWLASLRRLDRLDEARPALERVQARTPPPFDTTISRAGLAAEGGRTEGAISLALQWAKDNGDLDGLYDHAEFGRLFYGPEFAAVQQQHPPQPTPFAQTLAVLHFAAPFELTPDDLLQACRETGVTTSGEPIALVPVPKSASAAFAIPDPARPVWIAWGTGRCGDSQPKSPDAPLASRLRDAGGWMAVGVLTMAYQQHDESMRRARRLAVALARQRATLVANSEYGPYAAADPGILAKWQETGAFPVSTSDMGVTEVDQESAVLPLLELEYPDAQPITLEAHRAAALERRGFRRALSAAAQAHVAGGPPLRIQLTTGNQFVREPLWIVVRSAEMRYGDWTFDGLLEADSRLFGVLRGGLPVRIPEYQVQAFDAGDAPPVERPGG